MSTGASGWQAACGQAVARPVSLVNGPDNVAVCFELRHNDPVNIEVFVPWEHSGPGERSCAALMATGHGTIKLGLNPLPRLEYPSDGPIPRLCREPSVVWDQIDDRQTELTLEEAGWLIDALNPDPDLDAVVLLEPLGLEVFGGTEINQWFDDVPHVFRDFEKPGYIPCDVAWWEIPERVVLALKALVNVAPMLVAAPSQGATEVPDEVSIAVALLGESVRVDSCSSDPDGCECLAVAGRAK